MSEEKKAPKRSWQRRRLPKKERIQDTVPISGKVLRENLSKMSLAEIRVYLYIATRSVGWGWDSEQISTSVMMEGVTAKNGTVIDGGTGLSDRAVQGAVRSLLKKKLIWREYPYPSKPPVYSVVSPEVRSAIFGKDETPPDDEDASGEEESGENTGEDASFATEKDDAQADQELTNSRVRGWQENATPQREGIANSCAEGGESLAPPDGYKGVEKLSTPGRAKGVEESSTPGVESFSGGGWKEVPPIEKIVKKRNFEESDLVEDSVNGRLFEHKENLPHIHSVDQSSPEKPDLNRDRESRSFELAEDDRTTDEEESSRDISKNHKSRGSSKAGKPEKPWRKFAATAEGVPEEKLTDEQLSLAKTWAKDMGFDAGAADVARVARVAHVCGEDIFRAVAKKCADAHSRKPVSHPWPHLCTAAADALATRPSDALAARIKEAEAKDEYKPPPSYASPREIVGGLRDERRKAKTPEEEEAEARKFGFRVG